MSQPRGSRVPLALLPSASLAADYKQAASLPHATALAYHPHTLAVGKADLHAFRLAMFARRNACEALFSALQVGHKLGLDGAERTRTAKEPTVKALLSLAMMMRSARMLASQRMERGDFPPEPPPDLALKLGL